MLQSMGSQRVRHDLATVQHIYIYIYIYINQLYVNKMSFFKKDPAPQVITKPLSQSWQENSLHFLWPEPLLPTQCGTIRRKTAIRILSLVRETSRIYVHHSDF